MLAVASKYLHKGVPAASSIAAEAVAPCVVPLALDICLLSTASSIAAASSSSSMAVAIEATVVHLLASFAGFGPKHSSFAAMQ